MSVNEKLLVLNLDYEVREGEKATEDPDSTAQLTQNLILLSFTLNYAVDGMDDKTSRVVRNIRRALNNAMDAKRGYVLFSTSDSETIYKEVYDAKYNPMQSRWVPYLYDELDLIKNRSSDEELKLQEEYAALYEKSEEVRKDAAVPQTSMPLKVAEKQVN